MHLISHQKLFQRTSKLTGHISEDNLSSAYSMVKKCCSLSVSIRTFTYIKLGEIIALDLVIIVTILAVTVIVEVVAVVIAEV